MTRRSVRGYAFAVIILLALSLPSAFAQQSAEVPRGGSANITVTCTNSGNAPDVIQASFVSVEPPGLYVNPSSDSKTAWNLNPGESAIAIFVAFAPDDARPGIYTLEFMCRSLLISQYDGRVYSVSTATIKVLEKREECLIATATYGSQLSPEVQLLRNFRDRDVLQSFAGSEGMKVFDLIYYSFSPEVAQTISKNENVRAVMRYTLYPLIGILWIAQQVYETLAFSPEGAVVVTGAFTGSMIGLLYALPFYGVALVLSRVSGRKLTYTHVSVSSLVLAAAAVLIVVAEVKRLSLLIQFSTSLLVLTAAVLPGMALSAWALKRLNSSP